MGVLAIVRGVLSTWYQVQPLTLSGSSYPLMLSSRHALRIFLPSDALQPLTLSSSYPLTLSPSPAAEDLKKKKAALILRTAFI